MEDLKQIVHVDDDEDIRTISKMALELVGQYDVKQFESGEDALTNIGDHRPQLLLLDFMMPGMSGQELWHALRERPQTKDTPVVFMTAKTDPWLSKTLKEEGALDVILKPMDPAELCERLEAVWADYGKKIEAGNV